MEGEIPLIQQVLSFSSKGWCSATDSNSNQRRYHSAGNCLLELCLCPSHGAEWGCGRECDQGRDEMWKIWSRAGLGQSCTADPWQCWLWAAIKEEAGVRANEEAAAVALPAGHCPCSHRWVLCCIGKFTAFGQIQRLQGCKFQLNTWHL